MASTRAYILAKELGVKSSAIVNKCQDEGIDIKNHMSVISVGLAATIREWFSEQGGNTAVETATKVDLKKVRVKPKRTRKKKTQAAEDEVIADKPVEVVIEAVQESTADHVEETSMPVAIVEEQVDQAPEVVTGPEVVPEPEPEPEPIVPAGPLLEKPEPAKLSGPKIVRVEAPEPPRIVKHKPKRRISHDAPLTEPLMKQEDKQDSDIGGKGKRHPTRTRERTHGRRKGEYDALETKKSKAVNIRRQIDLEERQARLDAALGSGKRLRPKRKISSRGAASAAAAQRPETVNIAEPITVKNLSGILAVKVTDIITKLMQQGVMATANQVIEADVAEVIALEFGTELIVEKKATLEEQIKETFEKRPRNNRKLRSVVVTMLGHVDHGKTSLLDKIRSTKVTAGEAGGITQHIGAYQVNWGGSSVTFLDTPGHEAFTAMRARGANMTDVVVLVVAADDGVMPQTVEAIHHAKAANVPIIVALNKIDLQGCDINRIYAQFAENELTPAEWGGDTEVVKTSAITGEGIDDLLDHLNYVSELLELKADDTVPASGWVVEAEMSSQRGSVATLLIKEGQVKKGEIVLAGNAYGRIKNIKNSFGKTIKKAVSSMPIEITGLNNVPQAGDRFYVLDDINRAKNAAEENQMRSRENTLAKRTQVTLENLFSQIEAGNVKELNIIIRADVQGSVDVLVKYLSELSTEEVKIKILHAAAGGITEGDVILAEASNAIIIGFNVISDDHVARLADSKGIDVRFYNIIYRITEDLKKSMEGLLEPEEKEENLGRAVVRNTFKISKIGTIAGCYVNDGVITNKAKVRLIRDNIVIRDDLVIESLKHFKDDAREVKAGLECGIKLAKYDDVKVDDVLDFYMIVQVARTL
ncbi:MAG: translation initiation factor IF-2 [Planctomycetota bacterium]